MAIDEITNIHKENNSAELNNEPCHVGVNLGTLIILKNFINKYEKICLVEERGLLVSEEKAVKVKTFYPQC
jgi:hypothetical protein